MTKNKTMDMLKVKPTVKGKKLKPVPIEKKKSLSEKKTIKGPKKMGPRRLTGKK